MLRYAAYLFLMVFTRCALAQDGAQFTSLAGFDLGKVTLTQVTANLGPAKIVETGDAGEYEAKICYRVPSGAVHFLSSDLGGSVHVLLGFGISSPPSAQSCAKLRGKEIPSLELGGVRLGLSKAEFSRVIGRKVHWEGNNGRVAFESRRPITPVEFASLPKKAKEAAQAGQSQDYVDVVVSIVGTFTRGRLKEFRVWKVEEMVVPEIWE